MRFKNLLPSAQNCKWKSALSRLDSLVHYIPTSKQFYHSSLSAFFELPQFPSFPPPKISKQSTEATVRRHLREKRRSKKWTQFSVVNPSLTRLHATSTSTASYRHMPCQLNFAPIRCLLFPLSTVTAGFGSRRSSSSVVAASGTLTANSVSPRGGVYTVGDFMTRKEDLHVVKPTTTVDDALEALVEHRITGFPVIDDDWKLVGVVSDYDLLALDSISGRRTDNDLFPEVDSTWKTFNELQKLLNKTNGQVIGDLMTPAPLVVRETTNLEDAARLLLETKYRRLPVVDVEGKLVGIITRGNVVRAALQIKRESERKA